MNEHIRELAQQAGMVLYPTGLGIRENTIWGDRNIAKFAELVVRQCALKCLEDKDSQRILEHFGVE